MRPYKAIQEIAVRGKSNSSRKPKARDRSASYFKSYSSKPASTSVERRGIEAQQPLHNY